MESILDFFEQVGGEPARELFVRLFKFIPAFLVATLIFAAGLVLGWMVKVALRAGLRTLNLDIYAERSGARMPMQKFGIREPLSEIAATVAGLIVVFIFAVLAIGNLQLPATNAFLENLLLYLPNVFVAGLVMLLGWVVGRYVERGVLISAINAGQPSARLLSKGVFIGILFFAFAIAMEQLGIGKGTIAVSFNIILGGVVFSVALAFGLGGQDIARDYLKRKFVRENGEENKKDDIEHL